MKRMSQLMKRLAAITLVVLPLTTVADMAPMSREEWELYRWPHITQPSPAGYALASLAGVLLSGGLLVLVRLGRRKKWHDLEAVTPAQSVLLAILLLSACLCVERTGGFFSKFFEDSDSDSYEDYLFYHSHCRKCGSSLEYNHGRFCPKCHPERDNRSKLQESMSKAIIHSDVIELSAKEMIK